MIAKDSKSYPYLAIAQHYKVCYGEVLSYADKCEKLAVMRPSIDWMLAVWRAVYKESK